MKLKDIVKKAYEEGLISKEEHEEFCDKLSMIPSRFIDSE